MTSRFEDAATGDLHALARACGTTILAAHTAGRATPPETGRDSRHAAAIARFLAGDLNSIASLERLADAQIGGELESRYSVEAPVAVWRDALAGSGMVHPCPRTVGDVAQLLREVVAVLRQRALLDGHGERVTLSVRDPDALLAAAARFCGDLGADEARGIGGLALMVSMACERTPLASGQVTLLRPDALALTRCDETAADGLIAQLRRGEVVLESAFGETRRE